MLWLTAGCDSSTTPPAAEGGTPEAGAADGGAPEAGAPDAAGPDTLATGAAVQTDRGPVTGKLNPRSRAFLGIPYAAPPTGALRFMPPQPARPWTAARDATRFGADCIQSDALWSGMTGPTSEDCLFLNVWTPYPVPGKRLPVMVWIHGGGFISGGSSTGMYNGRQLVERHPVLVVSLNYRLGPLGFLAHKNFSSEAPNAGILDQQAALRWVQNNIAAFGGDPTRVTIFGESAGSLSVCTHLVAPTSAGLFQRAIMQSGACSFNSDTLARAQAQGGDLAQKLGCDTAKDPLACLRTKKANEVMNGLPVKKGFVFGAGVDWAPVLDGKLLTRQPYALLKAGSFNKVPLMIGTNANEGTLLLWLAGKTSMTQQEYETAVKALFPQDSAAVLKQYPVTAPLSPAQTFAELLGDMAFICSTRMTAGAAVAAGVKVRQYHFTVKPSASIFQWLGAALVTFLGSFHSSEIPFVFHFQSLLSTLNAQEQELSKKMMGYWTRFAASADPNATGEVNWPLYDKAGDRHIRLSLPSVGTGSGLKKQKCDFWIPLISKSFGL
jgi:para-nitrobenzyl esterase